MKLSTHSTYGVRAIYDIAYNSPNSPVQIQDIYRRQRIPPRYLEQIFQKLKRSGFLMSKRGPNGGYVLKLSPDQVSVGDIIRAVEGNYKIVFCIDSEMGRKNCALFDRCVTQLIWKEAQDILFNYFDSVSIADLCTMAQEKRINTDFCHPFSFAI
jgi:Rrf2 family protein